MERVSCPYVTGSTERTIILIRESRRLESGSAAEDQIACAFFRSTGE